MHQYTPTALVVPAFTAQSAPVTQAWTLYPGWVSHFIIRIPPGHSNLTGLRITYQGTPVIPFDPVAWLVGDNVVHNVVWEDEIMDRGLVVEGYNTDKHPHTFYAWADVDPHLPGTHHPASPAGPAPAAAAGVTAALATLGGGGG